MNQSITIENRELQVKEWNGQRVISFRDVDYVHQRPDGTAKRNFNGNKNHFIEGEDYYKISSDEIRTMGIEMKSNNYPNGLILITESGYLLLVKSFTDDLAWNIQRQLIKCYFRVKDDLHIEITSQTELSNDEWLRIGELISKTPKDRLQYLLVVFDKIVPGAFDELQTKRINVRAEVPRDFYKTIQKAMEEKGITQHQLGKISGLAKNQVSQYIRGINTPTGERLVKIKKALDIE